METAPARTVAGAEAKRQAVDLRHVLGIEGLDMRDSFYCPECNWPSNKVIDSRHSSDGTEIWRRRECVNRHRFTTRERINEPLEPTEIISGIFLP